MDLSPSKTIEIKGQKDENLEQKRKYKIVMDPSVV